MDDFLDVETRIDFDAVHPMDAPGDFLNAQPGDPDFMVSEANELNDQFLEAKKQSAKSKTYQKKVNAPFRLAFKRAIAKEETVPDAAALYLHTGNITKAIGDLAAENEKVANAIDWITEGADNPYASLVAATLPLALQLIRNHEPNLETVHRGIPIWKGKRILTRFEFKIKLGGWFRLATNDPQALSQSVFTDPVVRASLIKAGILADDSQPSAEHPATAPRKRAPRKATPPKA